MFSSDSNFFLATDVMSKDLSKFPNEQSAPSSQGEEYERPLFGMRILLVDDSIDNQILLKYMLQALGARLDVVDDGESALIVASQNHFDAVLLDLRLPRMTGDQVALKIRENGFANPIIGLTAHLGLAEYNLCHVSGFTECLERPVTRENLARTILNAIKKDKASH